MAEKLGLYAINNFGVKTQTGYALSITLDKEVVKAMINSPMKRDDESPLIKKLNQGIERIGGSLARLDFYKDTWFLSGIVIDRNCACFTIGKSDESIGKDISRNFKYSPHNIDRRDQADAILETWLTWFNFILPNTEFELPFAM